LRESPKFRLIRRRPKGQARLAIDRNQSSALGEIHKILLHIGRIALASALFDGLAKV
jgi:hypothetical protein